jgi:hypothetical protein
MGVPLATEQSDTLAARVVPRFSFEKNSPHPNAQKKPSPAAVSTTSINSGSTLANGPSGQTVVSQDLSSVVSQLQSQATEQSKMFKAMMDKQDKHDPRAARVQKKIMTMILTMMQNNQGSKKSDKNKKKSQQNRTKITWKKDSVSDHQQDVEGHRRVFVKSAKTKGIICVQVRTAIDVPDEGRGATTFPSAADWSRGQMRIGRGRYGVWLFRACFHGWQLCSGGGHEIGPKCWMGKR